MNNRRQHKVYCKTLIAEYISNNIGKITTPNYICDEIRKQYDVSMHHHTVRQYIKEMIKDGLVVQMDRKYVPSSQSKHGNLERCAYWINIFNSNGKKLKLSGINNCKNMFYNSFSYSNISRGFIQYVGHNIATKKHVRSALDTILIDHNGKTECYVFIDELENFSYCKAHIWHILNTVTKDIPIILVDFNRQHDKYETLASNHGYQYINFNVKEWM